MPDRARLTLILDPALAVVLEHVLMTVASMPDSFYRDALVDAQKHLTELLNPSDDMTAREAYDGLICIASRALAVASSMTVDACMHICY